MNYFSILTLFPEVLLDTLPNVPLFAYVVCKFTCVVLESLSLGVMG